MNRSLPLPDQTIVDIALAELLAELGTELLGLLVTGSRVNGKVDANSDLDLVAVIDTPRMQRRTRFMRGVEVVVELGPAAWVRRSLERDRVAGNGITQHMWATGTVIYDRIGVARSLQEESTAQWIAGPGPVPAGERWRFCLPPTKMLDDVELLMESDEAQAAVALNALLVRLLHGHFRVHNRWTEKAKRHVDALASWDPSGADLLCRASVGSLADRLSAAKQLVAHCLADIGGMTPKEDWQTEWQAFSPPERPLGQVSLKSGEARAR